MHSKNPIHTIQKRILILIHIKYAYPNNITKIPTSMNISPYLQIIHIKNHPLQPWLILHLYMPTHNEDIRLIPIIQQTINIQITTYPNHTYTLCGDFNRDIALIGRQNEHWNTPSNEEDLMWKAYTENIAFTYIPTNTNFSKQGGHNHTHTHTRLINGFYIKTQNPTLFTSTTLMEQNLNSDHLPIILHVPPNTLLAQQPPPITNHTTRIKNPIPQENLENLKPKSLREIQSN